MSRMQRDKGNRGEREVVNLHKAEGIHAERVILSGAVKGLRMGDGQDVDIYARPDDCDHVPLCGEVKLGGHVPKSISKWLADNDVLFVRRDHAEWAVVLPMRVWLEIAKNSRRARPL